MGLHHPAPSRPVLPCPALPRSSSPSHAGAAGREQLLGLASAAAPVNLIISCPREQHMGQVWGRPCCVGRWCPAAAWRGWCCPSACSCSCSSRVAGLRHQDPAARAGPVLRRLRVLEEQFRRFQEVTLSHLQSIARNYNISYNIDRRFQVLAEQAEAADAARAVLGAELAHLAAASRRLHRRVKRLEGAVGALTPQHHLLTHPEAGAEPHSLWDMVRTQQEPRGSVPPSTASTQPLKVRQRPQEEGHWLLVETGTTGVPMEDTEPLHDAQAVTAALSATATGPQEQPGTACGVGSVLLFPSASSSSAAILRPGLPAGLWALSLCTWVLTPAPRLGTVLSFASEDGDSKVAVHGQDKDPGSMRFVIGDTAFRELPVTPLLDGKWHHLCLTWSSRRGQYRFYVDRRLLAAGSGFQQGYEIPAGGSLVLGQLQGHVKAGFSPTGAFVGRLAGLALWSRALLPGEVASMATGRGLPRGPLLTLANASLQGEVQRVACTCLQHCP